MCLELLTKEDGGSRNVFEKRTEAHVYLLAVHAIG